VTPKAIRLRDAGNHLKARRFSGVWHVVFFKFDNFRRNWFLIYVLKKTKELTNFESCQFHVTLIVIA